MKHRRLTSSQEPFAGLGAASGAAERVALESRPTVSAGEQWGIILYELKGSGKQYSAVGRPTCAPEWVTRRRVGRGRIGALGSRSANRPQGSLRGDRWGGLLVS
jgi:hypothetical protein